MSSFSADEITVIQSFIERVEIAINGFGDEGITGYDDDGIIITEFETEYSYGDTFLARSQYRVPWIAFTDPDKYERQQAEEAARQNREYEAQRLAAERQREAELRKTYEALKAKFER